ncbi:MAG: DNA polymerase III subunit beta [Chloroflexi bacterium]|nr:DNA polymerase III subunit beta [Chloroflexota bacterium]
MKVSCLQENLARGLAIVGRAVASRSTLPVLGNIMLATDEGRLKLSATNLEIGINCRVGAKVEQEGAITIPARLLQDFVNSLPTERIDLELIARTQTLNLKCGRYEANIRGIDAQDFPAVGIPDEDGTIICDADDLRAVIDRVAFAAATDESRPVLTGVLAELATDRVTFAAADSYRLSVASAPLRQGPANPINIIIPARALQELRRISAEGETIEMRVAPNHSQVFFHFGDIDLVSQLIEGTFPNYRQIIPSSSNTKTVVSTGEFLQAARMAAIFARDAANIARLNIVPGDDASGDGGAGQMIVSATSSEQGDNVSALDVQVDGAPIEIAFNARYLVDALGVISSAQVQLETRDPSSPGVLRPVGDPDFVHIVMPMHIAR